MTDYLIITVGTLLLLTAILQVQLSALTKRIERLEKKEWTSSSSSSPSP